MRVLQLTLMEMELTRKEDFCFSIKIFTGSLAAVLFYLLFIYGLLLMQCSAGTACHLVPAGESRGLPSS